MLLTNILIPTNIVRIDCKKLAMNKPIKIFNKIDKCRVSVLANPSTEKKPIKDRYIRHETHKQAKVTPNFFR